MPQTSYDVVVVGSGPNGLAAAITMARAGCSVLVLEAEDTIGGGARSMQLTQPGFVHDICSTIHPLAVASTFFRSLPLDKHGVQWIDPPAPFAHPLDDGSAVLLRRSVDGTAAGLGGDGPAYLRLMAPLVERADDLLGDILGPLPLPPHHPLSFAVFGVRAMWPMRLLAERSFSGQRARALMAGVTAHAMLPLEKLATAAFGLVLAMTGHAVGWPMPRGGAQAISDAMAAYLRELGGDIVTGVRVTSLADLPQHRTVLFDLTPRQIVQIAGDSLPAGYRRQLESYRYGAGVFKIDWAIEGTIPWAAQECSQAATVHIGGTLAEIAAAESVVAQGKPAERPYVLLVQNSLFDSSRAPAGKSAVWAYCHVPNGSTFNMTERIEQQIERFAPGFRERIIARSVLPPAAMEQRNANHIGGDINGGIQDLGQLYARPARSLVPYRILSKGMYICSSSTPPGGGVHGMCGYFAAKTALLDLKC